MPVDSSSGDTNLAGRIIQMFISTPLISKILAGVLLLGFSIGILWNDFRHFFCLIPAETLIRGHLWEVVTYPFIEKSLIMCVTNVTILIVFTRLILSANIWNLKKLIIFNSIMILIIGGLIILVTLILYLLFNMLLGIGFHFFYDIFHNVHYSGFIGVSASLGVILKQHVPEYTLYSYIKTKNFPSIFLLFILIISVIPTFGELNSILISLLSTYITWAYLRFFEKHPSSNNNGDASEEFAFKSFFPMSVHGYVTKVSNYTYHLMKNLKIIKPRVYNVLNTPTTTTSTSNKNRLNDDDHELNVDLDEIIILEGNTSKLNPGGVGGNEKGAGEGIGNGKTSVELQEVENEIEKRIEAKKKLRERELEQQKTTQQKNLPQE